MADAKRRIRFNKRAIEGLEPAATRFYVHDTEQRGLVLVIQPSGNKAFFLYRWMQGRPERIRLGGYPDLTVEQARRLAATKIGTIAAGGNPAEERRKQRDETTFGEVWTTLHAFNEQHRRKARTFKRQHDTHLKRWDRKPLSEITRRDVSALHAKIGADRPFEANRVRSLVSRIFSFARERFDYDGPNPAQGVKRFREESRERFLSEAEIVRFLDAVEVEDSATWQAFFKMLLFTGARKGNVQRMRWADIDLAAGIWTIPAEESKNAKALRVVLAPEAIAILKQRQADLKQAEAKRRKRKQAATMNTDERRQWVFPARQGDGPTEEPQKAWLRILARAKLKDLRIHDLRRTLGSWAAAGGTSLPIIGRALGHQSLQSTQVYARVSMEPVRVAVTNAVSSMLAARSTEGNGNAEAKAG